MKISLILIFAAAFQLCSAARILFVNLLPSTSHYILTERLVEEMVNKGHEVTLIAPIKKIKPLQNLTEIVIPDMRNLFLKNPTVSSNASEGKFSMRRMNPQLFFAFQELAQTFMNQTMSDKRVQELLNSNKKFDLVIGTTVLMESVLAGFSHRFGAPLIAISPTVASFLINELVGNPAPAAYVPELLLGFTEKMSFFERVLNFVCGLLFQLFYNLKYLPTQDGLMRKHFGNDLPPIQELLSNTSLVLVNHHYSLAFPKPLLPNMIEVGSFHVKPPKPLPKDLKTFMDEAKEGVIFFSMGSNLESSEFPKEKFDGILKAFSKIKQRVLWKFENENPPNLPKNVKIAKWLPQSDILAHPNMRLFITHGGLLSTTESILRGIPLVGIPIFGDQPTNVKYIEKMELGVKLEFDDINENSFYNAIQEILTNPKYTNNVKLRSRILNDLPMTTIDTAVYWVEYIIRHKGAPHLRSAAKNLAWYQLYLLDVLAFIGVILFIFFYIFYKFIRCIYRTLFGGKHNVPSSKKVN